MTQLRDLGAKKDRTLKLEFFFYSNTLEKVGNLSRELKNLNYDVKFDTSAGDPKLFVSTGWTTKIKMDEETVVSWTREMCSLGYKFDCEFDGWGTNPDQDWATVKRVD